MLTLKISQFHSKLEKGNHYKMDVLHNNTIFLSLCNCDVNH